MLSEIVAKLGGTLRGEDRRIERLAPLDTAGQDDLAFLANPKYRRRMDACEAGAVIVTPALADDLADTRPLILAEDPYLYFARVATLFHPVAPPVEGIHPGSTVGEGSRVGKGTEIRELVSIGRHVTIGENCKIYPGVVIGDEVSIGDSVTLHANVTVYHGCRIGDRVGIHSGSVIGADGFGLAWTGEDWFKIPQTGRVIIEDDVEIGANTTIDRGAMADTVIRRGAKIDNLVQIAHNVQIGEHSAIAGCVGIAGSTRVGAYCTVGGAAMFVGHIDIADKTHIGGGTLVSKSIRTPGTYASSYPMSTMKDWMANAVHLRHLDDLVKRVKRLEREQKTRNNREDDTDE
ncbi:UDP-3-O-acylglucosamine N-acyltransferase [Paludibacterium paludis]|uniref:UDP-3-O-acylglucosamine N-acyltransferase n=2 Tax=Paludibacterium paludis TaxID=1225769 RepID=A0A918UBN3_9NEIS|nr:UDP-3-O-acylglucosamine N-acyltransferase [Paludibacterium paludis]